jgi:DNA-binding Lrp family transcriptional regulator
MASKTRFDRTDARILLALCDNPRATGVDLAAELNLSRNTVQARLNKWESEESLGAFDRRVPPRALNLPLLAFVTTRVNQHKLAEVTDALVEIPEVVEVLGMSGTSDLLVRVVALDADDLYRIAGLILEIPGVKRTNIGLAMRELVPYRVRPLIEAVADSDKKV